MGDKKRFGGAMRHNKESRRAVGEFRDHRNSRFLSRYNTIYIYLSGLFPARLSVHLLVFPVVCADAPHVPRVPIVGHIDRDARQPGRDRWRIDKSKQKGVIKEHKIAIASWKRAQ